MRLTIQGQIERYVGNISEDIQQFKTIKSCQSVIYRLSKPSKIPGYAYGLPASSCPTGSKLRNVEGSVCYGCYAADDWSWAKQTKRYSNYAWEVVKNANRERLAAISKPLFVPAMVAIINKRSMQYFRWHDTGDLQSIEHLHNIATICDNTPDTKHWLPTREYKIVESFRSERAVPDNLCIRVSAHMIGEHAPRRLGVSSMVYKGSKPDSVAECKAYTRDNSCGDCRACWDNETDTIGYKYH